MEQPLWRCPEQCRAILAPLSWDIHGQPVAPVVPVVRGLQVNCNKTAVYQPQGRPAHFDNKKHALDTSAPCYLDRHQIDTMMQAL